MLATRSTITAGAATLVTGAGLALVLLTGIAGATAPQPATESNPAGVTATTSVSYEATAMIFDSSQFGPTETVTASAPLAADSASPGDQVAPSITGDDSADVALGGVCSDTASFQPGLASTGTAPAAPAGQ